MQHRLGPVHSRLRGAADRRRGRREQTIDVTFPETIRRSSSPARRRPSTSRSRRSRRRARSRSTTTSPRRSASNRSPSSSDDGQGSICSASTPARSRQKLKRQLLDQLDELHSFELPPNLVEQEFDNIWADQVPRRPQAQGRTFEDEGTTEEEARADYRKIAERRVRLGLVIVGDRRAATRSR